jgi:hypothetical protein
VIWIAIAVGLASVWLLGACTLSLLDARGHGAAALAADYATGVAVLAFVGMSGIALGLGVSMLMMYGILAALVATCVLTGASARLRPSAAALRVPRDPVALALLLATLIMTALVLTGATADRLWWDGWSIWTFKAMVLFREGTLPATFMDPRGIYVTSNLDYPLAVPLLGWWLFSHAGATSAAVASFAGALWYALLPVLAWSTLRDVAGSRIAALAALGLAAFWPISFFAAGGTADAVIAVALLGAVMELRTAIGAADRGALIRAVAYLALAALAKNEGLALAVATGCIAGVAMLIRGHSDRLRLVWLATPVLLLLPWLLFTKSLTISSAALAGVSEGPGTEERLSLFLTGIRVLFSSTPWQPIPLLAILGLWAVARSRDAGLITGAVVVVTYTAALSLVLLRSSEDMLWLLTTAAPRLLGAIVPALVCLAAAGIVELELKLRRTQTASPGHAVST